MCEGDGMEEWKECRLTEIMDLIGGGTPKTSNPDYWDGDIPWISVKDFNGERRYVGDTEKKITKLGLENSSTKILSKGDIIISARGTVGELAIIPSDMAFNQSCYGLRAKDFVDSCFLYYLLKQSVNILKHNTHGSVFDTITRETFENISVKLPPLPTQQKIAAILSSLDDKIELNNKINTNLEQQAQALFKNWFVDFEPFGGKIPEGWKEIALEELCTVVTKGTTPTTLGKKFTETGINFIKGESILENHTFDIQKISHIDEETNTMLKRSIIEPNDILFTIAGTLGRFAMIDKSLTPANTNQAVGIIRENPEIVSPYYLYSFFIGNWHNDYYTKRIQQAVQANLSLGTIKSLPIIIPDSQNLNKYTSLIEPLFKQMKQLENENIKLSTLRDTLLPKLMNGEIEM